MKEMKDNNEKYIWGLVFVLILAVVTTAAVYISDVKQMAPTEREDVIALVPEKSEDAEAGQDGDSDASGNGEDVIEIETPKTGPQRGGNSTGGIISEKRQVGTLDADMTVEDENKVWTAMTKVNIFRKAYEGTKEAGTANEYTVQNSMKVDDMDLIAPGTDNDYVFWVKNTGQVGIDYRVWFEEHNTWGYELPLEVRVKCGDTYILGSKIEWKPIDKLDYLEHEGHLSVKHYAQYTLEWRWPFERGADEHDTYLGDTAVNKVLEQEIIIHTYGEGYDRPIYETFSVMGVKTGDAADVLWWLILAVFALLSIIYIRKKMKKRNEKEADVHE